MTEYLETTIDKFTFKVATDRNYTEEGVWALESEGKARIGLSDFLQQRSGDIAFAEIQPEGTALKAGDEIAVIETVKVNIALGSPISGKILMVNPAMELEPEKINTDPYGEGWLADVEPQNWEVDCSKLLDAQEYFKLMQGQAEQEAKKL